MLIEQVYRILPFSLSSLKNKVLAVKKATPEQPALR